MKQRRSLITLVAVFFVALACAFGVLNIKSKASAAEYIAAPTTFEVVEEGFELADKASIRLTDGKAAIKFTATVTEEFHNAHAGATYIATMNIVGSDDVKALAFGDPVFNSEGVATLDAYLNFAGASETILEIALATEFEAAAYAEVNGTYYQAKGSNTVDRAMRVVANDAYLNWSEGVGYEKEDVAELGYFTDGLRSDKTYAVVDTNNTLYVHIPGAPASVANIYVDDVKVEATYDEATDKYTVADFATEGKFITVFDADGKAYSTDFVTGAIAISNLNELTETIGVAEDLEGYYVLTSDIKVGVWTHVANKLYGTFNGLGYKLTDYSGKFVNNDDYYKGLFSYAYGATFKNVIMSSSDSSSLGLYGGILVGTVVADVAADEDAGTPGITYDNTVFDNIIVFCPVGNYRTAPIGLQQHAMEISDSIFVTAASHFTSPGSGIVYNNNTPLIGKNVISVTDELAPVANSVNFVQGVTAFNGMSALYNADQENDIVTDYQWSVLKDINAFLPITDDNKADLIDSTISYGIHVLMEDINVASIAYDTAGTSTWVAKRFTGALEGNGHTLTGLKMNKGASSGQGAYIVPGSALVVTNIGINMESAATNHSGVFGLINTGRLYVSNSAIKVDAAYGNGSSLFGYAPQKEITIKDSLLYLGSGINGGNGGWLLGATSASSGAVISMTNVYAINLSSQANICGDDSVVTLSKATKGTDYFYYTDPAQFVNDVNAENSTVALPAIVKSLYAKIGAIQVLSADTLAQAKTATGGYWYLEDDLDLATAGATYPLFANGGKIDGLYHGVNLYLDGRGHAITGFTGNSTANSGVIVGEATGGMVFKNLVLRGSLSGLHRDSGLFVGIFRSNNAACKINVSHVFVDLTAQTNGSLFGAWTPHCPLIVVEDFFYNNPNMTDGAIFTGNHWKGTIQLNNTFFVVPAERAIAWHPEEITWQNTEGTSITFGGETEDDIFAAAKFATLADLKASDGGDWEWAQETLGDLDPEFFEIQA